MAETFTGRIAKAWAVLRNQPVQRVVKGGMAQRTYNAARGSRLMSDWNPSNTSADSELSSSLTRLRARSRQLVRDASYAKRAQVIVVNNVIGSGIGMQAQVMTVRGDLNDRVNDDIEEVWEEWCYAENCHTGGRLAFKHLERAAMAQVFTAGEVFIRKHARPFGRLGIPYALELIEAERIADEIFVPTKQPTGGNQLRMGIECDEFYRPVAYWIRKRHPGELRWQGETVDQVERIPADQIIHLAVVDRWPQTRGEPWLHAAARRLNDVDGYSEAEIIRARVQANTPWTIETPEEAADFAEEQADGSFERPSEPGVAMRLNPGEKMNAPSVNSPNPALDPFLRSMLREIAAGTGASYESISRDYSQSNYSSSRLALLDDRDLWRFYQSWFCCDFRHIVHREWLAAAVLSRAITTISVEEYALNTRKFEAVLFKPRGWSWIDPTVEVAAYKEAITAGLTTRTDVIAQTANGQDIEDIDTIRERELRLAKERGLSFDTDPDFYMADANKKDAEAKAAAKPPPDPPADTADPNEDPTPSRVFHFGGKR